MKPNQLPYFILLLALPFCTSAQNPIQNVKFELDSFLVHVTNNALDKDDYEYFEGSVAQFSNYDPAKSISLINILLNNTNDAELLHFKASLHNHLGLIYRRMDLPENALKHHLFAADIFEQISEPLPRSFSLVDVGNIFFDIRQFDEAKKYYVQVISMEELDTLRWSKAVAYNNLGLIYTELEDLDSAKHHFLAGLEYREKLDIVELKSHSYLQMGEMYAHFGMIDSAVHYLSLSNQLQEWKLE